MPVLSYRKLTVWQKSTVLVTEIYKLTKQFPGEEKFGLTSQIRRAAVSIPSNIAEGATRSTTKSYLNFINMAYGSGAELETQIEISKNLNFCTTQEAQMCSELLDEIMRMLNSLASSLRVKI